MGAGAMAVSDYFNAWAKGIAEQVIGKVDSQQRVHGVILPRRISMGGSINRSSSVPEAGTKRGPVLLGVAWNLQVRCTFLSG